MTERTIVGKFATIPIDGKIAYLVINKTKKVTSLPVEVKLGDYLEIVIISESSLEMKITRHPDLPAAQSDFLEWDDKNPKSV